MKVESKVSRLNIIPESASVEKELAKEETKGKRRPIDELNKTQFLKKMIEDSQEKGNQVVKTDGNDRDIAEDKL